MINRPLKVRLWIEAILGAASAVALAVTLVWPDWIERLLGLDLDGSDGSVEWGLVAALVASTAAALAMGWRDWRALRAGQCAARSST